MCARTRWLTTLLAAAGLAMAEPALARPEAGWWWNPAESGRGFFIESLDNLIYLAGYLYQSDGHALWVVAGGPNDDPYNYTGRLLTYSGGQTLTGTYRAPNAPQDIGQVSIHFGDDTHATLTWPGGVLQLQREIFGTGASAFTPSAGWWWNPAESGRGYSIEVQGNSLFFVGFMYEDDGRPVWLFSAGPVSADPTTYSGPLLQFSNGQTMTGPYQPPGNPATVGHLDVAFTADNAGTLTFTRASASGESSPRADSTATVPIQSEFDKPGTYVPPPGFEGILKVDSVLLTSQNGIEENLQMSYLYSLTWVENEDLSTASTYSYDLDRGEVIVTLSGTQVTADGTCTAVGSGDTQFQNSLTPTNLPGFDLTANTHAAYTLKMHMDPGLATYTQTITCTILGSTTSSTATIPVQLDFGRNGAIASDVISGLQSFTQNVPGGTTSGLYNWSFHAIR